jgi:hypothetical protein
VTINKKRFHEVLGIRVGPDTIGYARLLGVSQSSVIQWGTPDSNFPKNSVKILTTIGLDPAKIYDVEEGAYQEYRKTLEHKKAPDLLPELLEFRTKVMASTEQQPSGGKVIMISCEALAQTEGLDDIKRIKNDLERDVRYHIVVPRGDPNVGKILSVGHPGRLTVWRAKFPYHHIAWTACRTCVLLVKPEFDLRNPHREHLVTTYQQHYDATDTIAHSGAAATQEDRTLQLMSTRMVNLIFGMLRTAHEVRPAKRRS